jgi:hypothetical protein
MPPRTFSALRQPGAAAPVPSQVEPIEAVIRRLLKTTADGARVLAWMREQVRDPLPVNATEAALRDRAGQVRFVELFHQIAEAR